jgi:ribosomal protein S21
VSFPYDRGRSVRPAPLSGVKVEPYPGEPIDSICKRFKKLVSGSQILADARAREYFVKPSERRRAKSLRAQRRRFT